MRIVRQPGTHIAALLVLVAMALLGAWATPAARAQTPSIPTQPIRAVVLIDESGSQSVGSVQAEANAAALLAFAELSNQSSFLVAGFGSSNAKNQTAIVQYCRFVKLADYAARERAAACARRAHRRKTKEGDDTDHAAALDFAVGQLGDAPAGTARVVFLLTDGNLNVCDSPQYGRTCRARNHEAKRQIDERFLPSARRAGIAIWPLGFGADARRDELEKFASGGAAANERCASAKEAQPKAVVVGDSATILNDLIDLLARARCAHAEPPVIGDLQPGKTVTLKVELPSIATDGAISVTKLDPRFTVEYIDPEGVEALDEGERDDQTFSRSGQNAQVEALRIENPKPGTWTVKVTAPEGRPAQRVLARAVWSGALQASLRISPVLPKPGQRVTVELHLITRYGVVRDPADLAGLVASAQVTGAFGRQTVALNDAGREGDEEQGDGTFSGPFTMPSGKVGCLEITGQIAKSGIAADERSYSVCSSRDGDAVGVIELSVPDEVHPGDTIGGFIAFDNQAGPRKVRLIVAEHSEGAELSVSPAEFSVPQGTTRPEFRLHVANGSRLGDVSGRLQLLDPTGKGVGDAFFDATAVAVPSWLERYWWLLAMCGLAIGGGAAAAATVAARRRRAALVDGLVAVLTVNPGDHIVSRLPAPQHEREFPIGFVSDDQGPRLLRPGSDTDAAFLVRRAGARLVVERDGAAGETSVPGTPIAVQDGVALRIDDVRRKTRRRRGPQASAVADPASIPDNRPPDDVLA